MPEKDLYPSVGSWFKTVLQSKFNNANIEVYDTSQVVLSRFLLDKNLHGYFSTYLTYEIQVDITGVILRQNRADLAFVECKVGQLTLRDVSQLLGYSRVALPIISVLLSPKPVSSSVHQLINVYRRYDVLEYATDRRIRICQWNIGRNEIDLRSTLPPGEHI